MIRTHSDWMDQIAAIDAGRSDPDTPVTPSVRMCRFTPFTSFGMRYPDTTALEAEDGRYPDWLQPFLAWFQNRDKTWRRLDTDPAYGFFVQSTNKDGTPAFGGHRACALGTLVLVEPRVYTDMMRNAGKAAEAAGWDVVWDSPASSPTCGAFTAFAPPPLTGGSQ